jgi:hypothetical protein
MNLDSLINGMNATLGGAIWGIVYAIKKIPGAMDKAWVQRVMPVIPLLLGVAGGAAGAVTVTPVTMANKIVAGLMVGGLTMVVFKVGKTTVMGKGVDGAAEADADPKE